MRSPEPHLGTLTRAGGLENASTADGAWGGVVLEPRLLLKDHRKLVFEPGPARRKLRDLRESEIIAGGDDSFLRIPIENEDRGADPGIDFAYSDPEGHWVAVELKISPRRDQDFVRQGLSNVQHYSHSHFVPFESAELWILDKTTQVLSVWSTKQRDQLGSYGLTNVVDMTPGASTDSRRQVRLDSHEVERRVDLWRQNISGLFDNISQWSINSGYTVDRLRNIFMDEELMQLFAVEPVQLPILTIRSGSKVVATVVPIGLWVIGAAGRVDVLTPNTSAMIVNLNPDLGSVNWMIYRTSDRSGESLDEGRFLKLIG
jgi:hypothetical protein